MKLNLVLAESALEFVPKELWRSPAVVSDGRRRELEPSGILLDRSFHHSAMLKLKDGEMRGRPDLVHTTLLGITGAPLYLDGGVKVYIHTRDDIVLDIAERTRIPKSYFRFRGLAEKLLLKRSGGELVEVYAADLKELIRSRISSDLVIGLSVQGGRLSPVELARRIAGADRPTVLIGGFPRGHFSPGTAKIVDELVRIDPRPLEAHVVASRLVYDVEKAVSGIND